MDKDKRAGKELLVLSGAHGFTHIFPVSVGALLPLLKGEFQISYLLIGIITLLIPISLSLASIPAGILADASYNKGGLIGVTFLLVTLCCVLLFFTHSLISATIILMSISILLSVSHPAASRFLCGWISDAFAIQNIFLLFSGAALFGSGFVIYFLLMKSYFESSHEKEAKI